MDCPVCLEPFDARDARPKVLPCGHSLCSACVQRLRSRQCPQCRQEWTQSDTELLDNFCVLNVIEEKRPLDALWCADCGAAASSRCLAEHDVRNPKVALRQRLQDVLPRGRQRLDGLQDAVQDAAPDAAMAALRLGLGACRLSLRGDAGEALGAEMRVDEEPLLQALVVALAASGRLRREEPAAAPQPIAEPVAQPAGQLPTLELDLDVLSWSAPDPRREEKDATLARVRQGGVRRLTKLHCDRDPAWALAVLRGAAPTVQELHVVNPGEEHLLAAHAMAGLRRLAVHCDSGALDAQPPELPPLARPGGLQWLRARGLPRPTVLSLLRAHSASLAEVWLRVGTPGGAAWPLGCDDLHVLLYQCHLHVQRLVLWRHHADSKCGQQLDAVRRVLPDATVQCFMCSNLQVEPI